MEQAPWLDELALAVADGRPIDWRAQDARLAADLDPGLIAPLKLVEQIVRAHRETTFDINLEEMTARPAPHELTADDASADDAAVTWGPLTIAERIGGGSYGDVYRAHDRRLDRTVALKLLRRRDSAQSRRASAVIEEGRLMARVRHPNVVTVFGAERIDGRVGLWMEYLEGQTLADELRTGGPFSEDAVVGVARAMCAALAAVHEAGLMHHDLKAQNVIRTTDGRLVLTDFGAGRQVMTDSGADQRQLRGTPAYLAPEVLNGQPATLQSEVYSLGVLLYYLSTGVFPDRTASSDDLRQRLTEEAGLSLSLSSLTARCLSPNHLDRFAAMPEVAEALTHMTETTSRTSRYFHALRKRAWLWLLPAVLCWGASEIWSAATPLRYQSAGTVSVVPPKVPASYVPLAAQATPPLETRIPQIRQEILSRTRLERIIQDLDLYPDERPTRTMEDIVEMMRSNIAVTMVGPSGEVGSGAIKVGFTSTDPRTAKAVAERLVSLFIDESTRDRKVMLEGTDQFLGSSIKEMKAEMQAAEQNLAHVQAGRTSGAATAEQLELEVLKEGYKELLTRRRDTQIMANLERREIGEQFRAIDSPTVPTSPIGPSRTVVRLGATMAGLLTGLFLVAVVPRREEEPQV